MKINMAKKLSDNPPADILEVGKVSEDVGIDNVDSWMLDFKFKISDMSNFNHPRYDSFMSTYESKIGSHLKPTFGGELNGISVGPFSDYDVFYSNGVAVEIKTATDAGQPDTILIETNTTIGQTKDLNNMRGSGLSVTKADYYCILHKSILSGEAVIKVKVIPISVLQTAYHEAYTAGNIISKEYDDRIIYGFILDLKKVKIWDPENPPNMPSEKGFNIDGWQCSFEFDERSNIIDISKIKTYTDSSGKTKCKRPKKILV